MAKVSAATLVEAAAMAVGDVQKKLKEYSSANQPALRTNTRLMTFEVKPGKQIRLK